MDYEYQKDVEVNLRAGKAHVLMVIENPERTAWYGVLYSPTGTENDPYPLEIVDFRICETAEQARNWCDERDRELVRSLVGEIEAFLGA